MVVRILVTLFIAISFFLFLSSFFFFFVFAFLFFSFRYFIAERVKQVRKKRARAECEFDRGKRRVCFPCTHPDTTVLVDL